MEKTLVLIKPDWIQRGLVWDVITRFEKKWLKIIACKMMKLSSAELKEHYIHIADKPFFPWISDFMQSSPVITMCLEWLDAIATVRMICWITKAREADMWTIRWDLAMSIQCNVVHASESQEIAKEEVKRFFSHSELFEYDKWEYLYVYSKDEINK